MTLTYINSPVLRNRVSQNLLKQMKNAESTEQLLSTTPPGIKFPNLSKDLPRAQKVEPTWNHFPQQVPTFSSAVSTASDSPTQMTPNPPGRHPGQSSHERKFLWRNGKQPVHLEVNSRGWQILRHRCSQKKIPRQLRQPSGT
jgi:hypothetical protein